MAPAAFVYFGAAAAIIGLCIMCFSMLTRLKYSRVKLGPYLASKCIHNDTFPRGGNCLADSLGVVHSLHGVINHSHVNVDLLLNNG